MSAVEFLIYFNGSGIMQEESERILGKIVRKRNFFEKVEIIN